jgi:hypothetical protein
VSPHPSRTLRDGVAISDYRPSNGDHLCSLWTDPLTDRLAGARFLLNAETGDAAVAIQDAARDADPATAAAGPGTDRVERFSTDRVHVEGGVFDAERMRRFWLRQAGRAREAGFRQLRAVAEMVWEVRGLPGSSETPLFESSLNPLFSSLPASVICQYGSARFSRETLLAMVLAHPLVVIGETVFSNPFHVDHERFPEHFASLCADPGASLAPVWTHFLAAQPTLHALARFLCNSLPTLVSADCTLVALEGLPEPLGLEIERDRVESAGGGPWRGLWDAGRQSRAFAEGPWGTVSAHEAHSVGFLTASLGGGRNTVVVARDGGFSELEQVRFAPLAWDIASALRKMPLSPSLLPAAHHARS